MLTCYLRIGGSRTTVRLALLLFPFVLAAAFLPSLDPAETSPTAGDTDGKLGIVLPAPLEGIFAGLGPQQSDEYRDALRTALGMQVLFCDGKKLPQRVEARREKFNPAKKHNEFPRSSLRLMKEGETTWHLTSPGRHDYDDTMFDAITLRHGIPVAMQFIVSSNFDSCPCESPEYPKFVGDELLATIVKIDTLEYLDLQHTSVTDACIALLAEMPKLEFVNLSNTKVTSEGLRSLKRIRQLRKLKLTAFASPKRNYRGPPRQGVEVFAALADCPNLRELQADDLVLDDAAIDALLQLRQLEELTIGGELNSNQEKLVFAGQPNWRSLNFGFTGSFGNLEFREMPELQSLSVSMSTSRTNSPQTVDLFENLSALETCSYSCSHNDRDGPPKTRVRPRFRNVPQLRELHISGFKIELDINEPLPELETLSAYTNYEPAVILSLLRFMPNLEQLDIHPRFGVVPLKATMQHLAPVLDLQSLRMFRMQHVKEFDFKPFEALPLLERLHLEHTTFPRELRISHPSLQTIRFRNGGCPESLIVEQLPNLTSMMVSGTGLRSATMIRTPNLEYGSFSDGKGAVERIDCAKSGIINWEKFHRSIYDRKASTDIIPPETLQAPNTNE